MIMGKTSAQERSKQRYLFRIGEDRFMPIINRFSILACGAMTFTGNTLGLSQLLNQNQAGVQGSIGAFTTLNNALQVPTFPVGTTLNINQNSSAANLVIPNNSNVLYAELIWGGNYLSRDQNIIALINNPVTFVDSNNNSFSINPDPLTQNQETFTSGNPPVTRGFYNRSANVTAIVQNSGAGTYSVAGVPGLLDPLQASTADTNHAGWTLAVIYENSQLPNRSMYLYIGTNGVVTNPANPIIDVPIVGFMTPPSGPVNIRILISAQEGDANITGDQALFGPTALSLTNLSGPRNPSNNFFGSQINNDSGNLDTTGTFGNRNQNPITATNISAGRQGWDITNVDATNYLGNNEMIATFRYTSTGDAYMPNALGVQIDQGDAVLDVQKRVNTTMADILDTLTYTITITNEGVVPANNVVFTDLIPEGSVFINDSVVINGVSTPGVNPETGISLPDINVDETVTIVFEVQILKCVCFLRNKSFITFSCGKITFSNQVLTVICKSCSGSNCICD